MAQADRPHQLLKASETLEDFALSLNEVDPSMSCIVVDEGDEISAPTKAYTLCRSPHVRMDKVELVTAPVPFGGKWKPVLLPELAGFTKFRLSGR